MKLFKIKNQYVVSPVKLSLADEMLLETGEAIEANATGDYEFIKLHQSSTYGLEE